MDLEAAIAWGVLALAIVVTVFAAAAEMALASLSRGRLRLMSEQGLSPARRVMELLEAPGRFLTTCLLYTSDAADDLLCVDLGGRRIIKKKHQS